MIPKNVKEFLIDECELTEEEIKEQEWWLKEHLHEISKYGLCPIYLSSLEPYKDFIKKYKKPPAILEDDEPKWEYALVLPMKKEYSARAGWTLEHAFREFLQNALDGAEEIGYTVDYVKVQYKDGLLYIENPSKKLLMKHMELGGSEKPCWARGRYGEGLDVASAWIVNTGGTVYILSHDVAYRFIGKHGRIVLLLGSIDYIGDKTVVIIYHKDAHKMEKSVNKILPTSPVVYERRFGGYTTVLVNGELKTVYCDYPAPNRILEKSEELARLYNRNIFVNYFWTFYGEDAMFDYDLWWFTVQRDRHHIGDISELNANISRLYQDIAHNVLAYGKNAEKEYRILKRFLDEHFRAKRTTDGIYFMHSGECVEYQIFERSPVIRGALTKVLMDEIAKYIGEGALEKVGFIIPDQAVMIRDYLYMGYYPVVVKNYKLFNLSSLDTLINRETEKTRESIEDARISFWDYLTGKIAKWWYKRYSPYTIYLANKLLNYLEVIISADGYEPLEYFRDTIFFAEFDTIEELRKERETGKLTIGFHDPKTNNIYFGVDRLIDKARKHHTSDVMFDLAFEEWTHFETGYSDNTADFEKALIKKTREFAQTIARDKETALLQVMADNGLFHNVRDQLQSLTDLLKYLTTYTDKPKFFDKYYGEVRLEYAYEYREDAIFMCYAEVVVDTNNIPLVNGLSPLAILYKDQDTTALRFILPEDYEKSPLIARYLGYLLTGNSNGLIKYINEKRFKHLGRTTREINDYHIVLILDDSIVVLDKNGKEVCRCL